MGIVKEFKDFAVKGNMVEMAIGIIIGAAFKDVVDVIVKNIMLPPLTMLTDGINFASRKILLREAYIDSAGNEVAEVAIGYGQLIEVAIDFFIISIIVFIIVKLMNRVRDRGEDHKDPTVKTPKDIELLAKMSELLEEQNNMLRTTKKQ